MLRITPIARVSGATRQPLTSMIVGWIALILADIVSDPHQSEGQEPAKMGVRRPHHRLSPIKTDPKFETDDAKLGR